MKICPRSVSGTGYALVVPFHLRVRALVSHNEVQYAANLFSVQFSVSVSSYGRLYSTLTLALTTSRPANQACLYRWHPLIWVLLPVEFLDLCRLDESHLTAASALLALAALPPVLADAAAAAVFAQGTPPPVLAETAAAALLANTALPPVLADAAAAALLAPAAPLTVLAEAAAAAVLADAAHTPVLADGTAAAVLARAALPSVLAEAAATTVLALGAPPPVLADAAAAAVLAPVALPPVLAEAAATTVLAPVALPPVLALLVHHTPPFSAATAVLAVAARASQVRPARNLP